MCQEDLEDVNFSGCEMVLPTSLFGPILLREGLPGRGLVEEEGGSEEKDKIDSCFSQVETFYILL